MTSSPSIAARLLDLVYPPRCAGCSAGGSWYCAVCLQQTPPIAPPLCDTCGQPSDYSPCAACVTNPPVLVQVRAAAAFQGPLRNAVHRLKYGNLTAAALAMAGLMQRTYIITGWPVDLIVPVPLHPSRQRRRGYNQAAVLAQAFGRLVNLPTDATALQRLRSTADQIGLDANERRKNVSGAFLARHHSIAGRTALLVDDVATTGCTLDACGSALLAGGAAHVYGLVLARRSLDDASHNSVKDRP